jgi:sec-independent protein translocase protein TatC
MAFDSVSEGEPGGGRKMKNQTGEMPFLDHLEELRWRIIWSLIAIVVGFGVGVWLVIQFDIIDLLNAPLYSAIAVVQEANPGFGVGLASDRLFFSNLTEPFFFVLKLGFLTGMVIASPVVVYQAWAFLSPALEAKERRVIIPSLSFGVILFGLGASFAYFLALPGTIRFLLLFGAEWFSPILTGGPYLALATRLLFAFGVVFELPVVVMILSALGLVTPEFLRKKRRHAIVGITILAAFLSPGDVVSVTLMLMAPLAVLYEMSIGISAVISRKQGRVSGETGDGPDKSVPFVLAFLIPVAKWRAQAVARPRRSPA